MSHDGSDTGHQSNLVADRTVVWSSQFAPQHVQPGSKFKRAVRRKPVSAQRSRASEAPAPESVVQASPMPDSIGNKVLADSVRDGTLDLNMGRCAKGDCCTLAQERQSLRRPSAQWRHVWTGQWSPSAPCEGHRERRGSGCCCGS